MKRSVGKKRKKKERERKIEKKNKKEGGNVQLTNMYFTK